VYQEWVASMDGLVNATILARCRVISSSRTTRRRVSQKGTLLFEIGPAALPGDADEARAALAKQQAVLQTAQANLKRICAGGGQRRQSAG